MKTKGQLLIMSGPSGVGKSTIVSKVLEKYPELRFSVSATTREKRPGEVDGVNYYFVTKEQFEQMLENNELLEHAEYVGNYYGTPAKPIDEALEMGYDVLLDIEVQGAMQVRAKRPDAITMFIMAPSFEELEQRLRGRGDTAEDKIVKRLETAHREYKMIPVYDYLLVSRTGKPEETAADILAILRASHCITARRIEENPSLEIK